MEQEWTEREWTDTHYIGDGETEEVRKDCELCAYAREHGWWGKSGITHCGDCHAKWGGLRMAHCPVAGGCHRTFSTDRSASLGHPEDRCVSDDELQQLGLVQVAHAHGVLWRWEKRRETP